MSQSEFTDPFLRERYGIKSRRLPTWVVPAVAIAIVGGPWLVWSANHFSKPEIRPTLISFQAVDGAHMEIRYSLIFRTKSKAHTCLLTARDYSASVVGEITDSIPAGVYETTRTIRIPTRALAVNAGIENCRS
ncbi:MAG: DUF4307 domain-containing protein [Actinomycetes bacterium]